MYVSPTHFQFYGEYGVDCTLTPPHWAVSAPPLVVLGNYNKPRSVPVRGEGGLPNWININNVYREKVVIFISFHLDTFQILLLHTFTLTIHKVPLTVLPR